MKCLLKFGQCPQFTLYFLLHDQLLKTFLDIAGMTLSHPPRMAHLSFRPHLDYGGVSYHIPYKETYLYSCGNVLTATKLGVDTGALPTQVEDFVCPSAKPSFKLKVSFCLKPEYLLFSLVYRRVHNSLFLEWA